jgi:hypothetical protein
MWSYENNMSRYSVNVFETGFLLRLLKVKRLQFIPPTKFRCLCNITFIIINNFRRCNVGTAYRRDLRRMTLKWIQVVWYKYQVSWRVVLGFKQILNLRCCNVGITEGWNFINYAFEVGSGAMIYIPYFIKAGSGIQQIIGPFTLISAMWVQFRECQW